MAVVTGDAMQLHDIVPENRPYCKILVRTEQFYCTKTCLSSGEYADKPKNLERSPQTSGSEHAAEGVQHG